MITERLHFTASSRHFGEIVTAAYVPVIAFVPLFFPRVPFLAIGYHDARRARDRHAHRHDQDVPAAAFLLSRFAAIVLLLPISIYAFACVIRHDLMQPISWLFAFLYILFGLVVAQQISSGRAASSTVSF